MTNAEGPSTSGHARELLRAALTEGGRDLQRLPGRAPSSGLHEVRELGPALRTVLARVVGSDDRVKLNDAHPIAEWTRPTTRVDLVVLDSSSDTAELAAELKVWDIGHQLFDLAKIGCLLQAGVHVGFLVCVAKTGHDFGRKPGGVLFPGRLGDSRDHDFLELINTYHDEWRRHVGKGGPEPTAVPRRLTTTAVAAAIPVPAYPGHCARAVEVTITDPTLVPLANGWPESSDGA